MTYQNLLYLQSLFSLSWLISTKEKLQLLDELPLRSNYKQVYMGLQENNWKGPSPFFILLFKSTLSLLVKKRRLVQGKA